MQSGSRIELGYVRAIGKNIVVRKSNLPYLAVGMKNYSSHAVIIDVDTISSDYFGQIYTDLKNVLC